MIIKIVIIVLFLASFVMVSSMSFEDEKKDVQIYCSMVDQNIWPDYKGISKNECPKEDSK